MDLVSQFTVKLILNLLVSV